jgi:catechol 2,3-dioxygenase-like lactoylglutathione lyase family enzyme
VTAGERREAAAMIDHIGFNVSDLAKSRAFYAATLAPLGVAVVQEGDGWVLFGEPGNPHFGFGQGSPSRDRGDLHVAFKAKSRADVRAFHEAGLKAGGKDNGGPGIRAHYHANYYAAFLFDPDGLNIEAVCHAEES